MANFVQTANELMQLLRRDAYLDQFINSFNKSDLIARKLLDRNQMYNRLQASVLEKPGIELTRRVDKAVQYCEKVLMKDTIISNQLYQSILCITRPEVNLEDNMPFTLSNVIFLPKILISQANKEDTFRKLCDTLIHEATHVLQRLKPKITSKIVEKIWGFNVFSDFEFRELVKGDLPTRSNPDTSYQMYLKDNVVWTFVFNSETPLNLSDGLSVSIDSYNPKSIKQTNYEHPYEMMAYMMPTVLTDGEDYNGYSSSQQQTLFYKTLCKFILHKDT